MPAPSKNGVGKLVDAPAVAAAEEGCGEERLDARFGHFDADQPAAERDHIGVIMLARQPGRERLRHQCAAAGRVAVGGDRNADSRAAQGDPEIGAAGGDLLGELVAIIGIIDRFDALGAEIVDLMSALAEPLTEQGFEIDGGMVGSNGDPHAPPLGVASGIRHWILCLTRPGASPGGPRFRPAPWRGPSSSPRHGRGQG